MHSLEELFPVGPGSEDPSSEMSLVSSEGERSSPGHQLIELKIKCLSLCLPVIP